MAKIKEIAKSDLKLQFDHSYSGLLYAVQADAGRTYRVQILSSEGVEQDVTGLTLELYIGTPKEVTKAIGEIVDAERGIFDVTIEASQLIYPGVHKAQFLLHDADGDRVGSKVFDIHIEESLGSGVTVGHNVYVDFDKISKVIDMIEDFGETLADAKETDLTLKVNTDEGIRVNKALESSIHEMEALEKSVAETKTSAEQTDETLKKDIETAGGLSTALSEKSAQASEIHGKLADHTSQANEADQSLRESTQAAQEADTTLQETHKKAEATEESLRNIILSGNLDAYVKEPQLREAIEAIDVSGQLLEYIKKKEADQTYLKADSAARLLESKVDKEEGKGLSTNDFTDEEKEKLGSIQGGKATVVEGVILEDVNGVVDYNITMLRRYSNGFVTARIFFHVSGSTVGKRTASLGRIPAKFEPELSPTFGMAVASDADVGSLPMIIINSGDLRVYHKADGSLKPNTYGLTLTYMAKN